MPMQKTASKLVVLGGGAVVDAEIALWMFAVELKGGVFNVNDLGVQLRFTTLPAADQAYFLAHDAESYTPLLSMPPGVM